MNFETLAKQFGMTANQAIDYILTGDVRHSAAPADVCGMIDPRDSSKWCRLNPDHDSMYHSRYTEAEMSRK